MTSIPFYLEADVARLVLDIPYARLMKSSDALTYWSSLCTDARELASVLHDFPRTKYAPLEPLYVCARAVASLDEHLVQDLVTHWTWRGAVYASFFCSLKPEKRYRAYLLSARHHVPHNQWLIDLAIAEIDGAPIDGYAPHQECLQQLRQIIEGIPAAGMPLRRGPQQSELPKLSAATREIAQAYKRGGALAARLEIEESAWRPFL